MTRTPSPPPPEVKEKDKQELQIAEELDEFHKTVSYVDVLEKLISIVIFSICFNSIDVVEVLGNKNKLRVVDAASQLYKGTYDEMKTGFGPLDFPDSHIISTPKNFIGVTELFCEIIKKIAACTCLPPKMCWPQFAQISTQNVDYAGEGSLDFSRKRVSISETPLYCLKNCKTARTASVMGLEYCAGMLKKIQRSELTSEEKTLNFFHSSESEEEEEVYKNIDCDDMMVMQSAVSGTEKNRGDNRYMEMVVLRRTRDDWLLMLRSGNPDEETKIIEKIHFEKTQWTKGSTHGQTDLITTSPEPSHGIPDRQRRDSVCPSTLLRSDGHNRGDEGNVGFNIDFDKIAPKLIDPKRKSDHRKDGHFSFKGNLDDKAFGRSVPFGDASLEVKGVASLRLFSEGLPAQNPESPQPASEESSGPSPECPSDAGVGDLSSAGVDGPPGAGNTGPSGKGAEGISGQTVGASSSPKECSSVAVCGFPSQSVEDASSVRMSAGRHSGITLSLENAADEHTGHAEHMESFSQRTREDETVTKQLSDHEALAEHGTVASHSLNPTSYSLPDLEADGDSSSHIDQPLATEAGRSVANIFGRPVPVSSPTNSQHIDHAYPEQYELEQDSHHLCAAQCEGSGRRPGGSILPSGIPHRESGIFHERSERWGGQPVSAHQQFHFTAQPINEGMPYTTQETISFSFSPQEPFHDSGRPPATVHAAGSMPSWATTEARIDLSMAANRSRVQLRTRLWTYGRDWRGTSSDNDPANMALAGFYRPEHRGRRVRCFYCGLELDIASHHNIWDEHVRFRPTCAYLRAIVGSDFIAEAELRLARESGN